jgi:hypothetical protein
MASVNFGEEGAAQVAEAHCKAGIGVEAGIWSVDDPERLRASGFATRLVRVLVEIRSSNGEPDCVDQACRGGRGVDRSSPSGAER